MTTPPKQQPSASSTGGGPSIRLNLPPRQPTSSPTTTTPTTRKATSPPQPNKKRRFTTPTNVRSSNAIASSIRLLHQKSSLSFFLHKPSRAAEPSWHAQGRTSLYVLDESPLSSSSPSAAAANAPSILQLAFHCRATCRVSKVEIEAINKKDLSALSKLNCSYQHLDPLEKVLLKSHKLYDVDDKINGDKDNIPMRHEADSQASRGATGMTNALRAASIASNMGELRISTVYQHLPKEQQDSEVSMGTVKDCWKQDISRPVTGFGGSCAGRLVEDQLNPRVEGRKGARVELLARTLAGLDEIQSQKQQTRRAMKITISYKLCLGKHIHFGGIHAVTSNLTPHVYTTSGVYGDHEGPRCWIPTLDSASTKHRASHEITIQVTAPMVDGISAVGCGEDYGVLENFLHDDPEAMGITDEQKSVMRQELGQDHLVMIEKVRSSFRDNVKLHDAPHVIPPESAAQQVTPIDAIFVTSVWASCSWAPIPSRSLGFAIGPFRVLEDPEYFKAVAEDESNGLTLEARQALDVARENGEGIRQVFVAPLFARKHVHATANAELLPDTDVELAPLTKHQIELLQGLDQCVITATVGVPHRTLSLMRDILAFPAFRTVSYTQIWIPNAVHGGSTSGALHCCPEGLVNPFLGGAIMDSRLLPPAGHRLPYHYGGRVLQFLQARCAIRGWITSAIPLGGRDDVGFGYIHSLFESFIMSMYERGHGAFGEGGANGGVFFTKRFAIGSGLNSSNLDFLPVQNIEDTELDVVIGGVVGAVPVEDRNNDQLWRSASNGTESHTSGMDEFAVRQVLCKDSVDVMERGTPKDRQVPLPSMGWFGSHLSLSFLSSNATSSSDLGCGALELVHPTGGLPYRALKGDLLRRVVEGRAGIANFLRLVRVAFIAAHLDDSGKKELKYPPEKKDKDKSRSGKDADKNAEKDIVEALKPRFIVCVNEVLKKGGLTHTLFTRALQNLAGRIREAQLLGTLVDVERESKDPRSQRPFVEPEGFPNSYVRGASELFLRVGVHVEPAREGSGQSQSGIAKGIQMLSYAEPVIPEGGIAFGGPVTVRVVENEGQFREFVKEMTTDGSRRDWGSLFLHAKPVTLPKAQTAASGIIESGTVGTKDASKNSDDKASSSSKQGLGGTSGSRGAFTESYIHGGGYQAIELIRLTNLTPLLWVRVDPMGLYGGRISVFQPDACLAEQLFHDGDAGAQVDSLRALAERPLRIQGSVKVTSIFDVAVSELPVRVLGDCLRGSPALHSAHPHTPTVRAQAALAIAQWQNNKAPSTKNAVGANHWVGLHLLIQYFKERFYNHGTVMPVKFSRVVVKKNHEVDPNQTPAATTEGANQNPQPTEDHSYHYLDSFDEGEVRAAVLEAADEIEVEEDEEYRVRSAVITAVASIRAKDGMTPAAAVQFLETILEAVDAEMVGNLVTPDEEGMFGTKRRKMKDNTADNDLNDGVVASLPYVSSMLVADALLALCFINVSPAVITDPATGKPVQSKSSHPVSRLMETSRRWLEWELYREGIRAEIESESLTGVSGICYQSIAACAISALSSLAVLRQSTTDQSDVSTDSGAPASESGSSPRMPTPSQVDDGSKDSASTKEKKSRERLDEAASAKFYISIYDSKPRRPDVTLAACAQAVACICCAADRFEDDSKKPVGLLSALEFMLDRIVDPLASPGLRQTLAQLMLDACTGKICSMQRVGVIGGRNDLFASAARYFNGPLGASHGGDNGSAAVNSVDAVSFPAASAVNDGAHRGLKMIGRAGYKSDAGPDPVVARIARFATVLWRTINGEPATLPPAPSAGKSARWDVATNHINSTIGVCANDGQLRCTLLAFWQWVFPRGCYAIMKVNQSWKQHEGTQLYKDLGADRVLKMTQEEKEIADAEEASLADLSRIVTSEIDRQKWRGEMAIEAYKYHKSSKSGSSAATAVQDAALLEQGVGQPLPPIERDTAFKSGGWIASAAQQRRAMALDGGTAVFKVRLRKSTGE